MTTGTTPQERLLRKALEFYADKSRWRKEVIDSYSGECSLFDWPGDMADEPWEIAQKALDSNPFEGFTEPVTSAG